MQRTQSFSCDATIRIYAPNGDQPIICGYKGGSIYQAVQAAKKRGEDVGAFDEDHPCHHLVLDIYYSNSGEATAYYAPYIPQYVKP